MNIHEVQTLHFFPQIEENTFQQSEFRTPAYYKYMKMGYRWLHSKEIIMDSRTEIPIMIVMTSILTKCLQYKNTKITLIFRCCTIST